MKIGIIKDQMNYFLKSKIRDCKDGQCTLEVRGTDFIYFSGVFGTKRTYPKKVTLVRKFF